MLPVVLTLAQVERATRTTGDWIRHFNSLLLWHYYVGMFHGLMLSRVRIRAAVVCFRLTLFLFCSIRLLFFTSLEFGPSFFFVASR